MTQNRRHFLQAMGPAALVGSAPPSPTLSDRLPDAISVAQYGAKADGISDDSGAIQRAMGDGGRAIFLPAGRYLCKHAFTVPDGTTIVGASRLSTVLLRGFKGDLVPAFGSKSAVYNLSIDGQGKTWGEGVGLVCKARSTGQYLANVEIRSFVDACVRFMPDSGSLFCAVGCAFYSLGELGIVGAITIVGVDTEAASRKFFGCESGGCTLYDFGGARDTFVSGGYSNGLIFGTQSSRVFISNMRIGRAAGTVVIKGSNHQLSNCVFAGDVILDHASARICLAETECPSYAYKDDGRANRFVSESGGRPKWFAGQTSVPVEAAEIEQTIARNGRLAHVTMFLRLKNPSALVPGVWSFSLPYKAEGRLFGTATAIGPSHSANGYVELASQNSSYVVSFGGAPAHSKHPSEWAIGDELRCAFSYLCF